MAFRCYTFCHMAVSKFERTLETQRQKLLEWHSYLRISSTYSLATRLRAGLLTNAERKALPPNFDQVLLTHDKFGDVWEESAERWFADNALTALQVIKGANQPRLLSSLFAGNEEKTAIALARHVAGEWQQQGKQPELLISIPVNAKRADIHKLLDDALNDLSDDVNNGAVPKGQDMAEQLQFQLMDTKVRLSVIEKMRKLVVLRSTQPELLNWQLAQRLGLSPAHVENIVKAVELKKASNKQLPRSDRATNDKVIINSLVGRYIRKAFLIAENAAYGRFPCFDEMPRVNGEIVKTHFDYKAIANGTSREYYKWHGAQPDSKTYKPEWAYYPEDDDWWEESIWKSEKPNKREAELDLGEVTDDTNDPWWSGGDDEDEVTKS